MSRIDGYKSIMIADEFVKEFETMEAFKDWCRTGELLDLEEFLKICEAYELYEHCVIIKKVIDEKN